MTRCLVLFTLLFTSLAPSVRLRADDKTFPAIPKKIDLQDGDTFVFLGDSITHQRLYTQYVENFFYQRFPERRIRFHNAGIGGARAWDALARLDRDVLSYKPRYVSILLGMNDGSYRPFDVETFETYRTDMTAVVERLRASGAVPILMSPTMFDARAARIKPNPRRPRNEDMLTQYNSVLAYYGRWLQEVAADGGMSYVDMYGLLNDLTMEAREKDGNFTLITDAIHPDPPGQIVMAYAMIDDLGLRKPLSTIRILPNAKTGFQAATTGGELTNLKATDSGMKFDWTCSGLPWVLPEEAQAGVKLLNLGHKATKESLEVHGLPPGRYEILIDDVPVMKVIDTTLSRHIELQNNAKTPQYQQALEVAMLNKKRNEGPVKQLRDAWRVFQSYARSARQLEQQPGDTKLKESVARLETRVRQLEEQILAAEQASREMEDQIYKANQPVTRHYQIVKVK